MRIDLSTPDRVGLAVILVLGILLVVFGLAGILSGCSTAKAQTPAPAADSANVFCLERGHIWHTYRPDVISAVYYDCTPYIVDLPDRTLKVTPYGGHSMWKCERCKLTKPMAADTLVLWRRARTEEAER